MDCFTLRKWGKAIQLLLAIRETTDRLIHSLGLFSELLWFSLTLFHIFKKYPYCYPTACWEILPSPSILFMAFTKFLKESNRNYLSFPRCNLMT